MEVILVEAVRYVKEGVVSLAQIIMEVEADLVEEQ